VIFPSPLAPNADGSLPYFVPGNRYIIRKKGVLEAGINSRAGCHTRVMPDGSYLPGAQGVFDFPGPPAAIKRVRNRFQKPSASITAVRDLHVAVGVVADHVTGSGLKFSRWAPRLVMISSQ
jgi:hypothetical protein